MNRGSVSCCNEGGDPVKPWLRNVRFLLGCAGLFVALLVVSVAVLFTVQYATEEPEAKSLAQELLLQGDMPGRIVLDLSSADVSVQAGPAGGPVRVESDFDPDVFRLEHGYVQDAEGGWTYRVDFHEVKTFHVSVVGIWLGKREPKVLIEIPADLPVALEATMEGGYLAVDLAGLAITTASLELNRGVLGVIASEPLDEPLQRLDVDGKIGTMFLKSVGNASPRELYVSHGIGAARVDLEGMWRGDADVDFRIVLGDGELILPEEVRIRGLGRSGAEAIDREIPLPTLNVTTRAEAGGIQVVN